MSFSLFFLLLVLVLVFVVAGIYNRLVRLRNQVKNAWSQIDVQLQRRYDLIPNLIETVKGYMEYEKSTLEAVVQARSQAVAAREKIKNEGGAPEGGALQQLMGAEKTLRGALGNIFALAENYPQLRASENMRELQEELRTTENKIAFSRQSYNDQVLEYNNAQQQVPSSFFASIFGHHPADLYELADAEAKKAVKVKF